MRKFAGLVSAAIASTLLLAACSTNPTAVRGVESAPAGSAWSMVIESHGVADPTVAASGTYMGASADGSYIGFIYPDGTIRWWHR